MSTRHRQREEHEQPRRERDGEILLGLAFATTSALAQPAPPPPGTTNLDTNGDGTQDVGIRRLDTDGVAGTTERVHVDANKNGVIDAGERVFDGVIGYMIINGVLTMVEDTGTERVKTVIVPFDRTATATAMTTARPPSATACRTAWRRFGIQLPSGPLSAQLNGSTTFEGDLNAITRIGGLDTIPIEIVSMSLTGAPQPITVTLRQLQPSVGMLVENANDPSSNPNLDARLFAANGTLDSLFDVVVEIDLSTGKLIPQQPLRLRSTTGIWPPAPLQTYFLVNLGIPLLDENGQLAGFLERFDFTPHVAPRIPCKCEKVSIKPEVETEKGKPLVVTKVTGVVTLRMQPTDCEGDPWTMVLVYESNVKELEVRIDALLSNWDGDKKHNAADKNPLDPTKD